MKYSIEIYKAPTVANIEVAANSLDEATEIAKKEINSKKIKWARPKFRDKDYKMCYCIYVKDVKEDEKEGNYQFTIMLES